MNPPKDLSQTCLRFLNLVNAVRGLPSFPGLDAATTWFARFGECLNVAARDN